MIAEIIEKNKNQLRSTGSFMMPGIDLIIDLMRIVEIDAGEALFSTLRPLQYSKGDYLIREGELCKDISLLETGIARQFINKKGSEPSTGFILPGEFIATYRILGINTRSKENIQFETRASGYSMSWANLERLKLVYPMLAEVEKLSFGFRTYWFSERFYQMTFSTAREKYLNLQCWPQAVLQQIPITHIAHYLGVSLETLSRLRGEINLQENCII